MANLRCSFLALLIIAQVLNFSKSDLFERKYTFEDGLSERRVVSAFNSEPPLDNDNIDGKQSIKRSPEKVIASSVVEWTATMLKYLAIYLDILARKSNTSNAVVQLHSLPQQPQQELQQQKQQRNLKEFIKEVVNEVMDNRNVRVARMEGHNFEYEDEDVEDIVRRIRKLRRPKRTIKDTAMQPKRISPENLRGRSQKFIRMRRRRQTAPFGFNTEDLGRLPELVSNNWERIQALFGTMLTQMAAGSQDTNSLNLGNTLSFENFSLYMKMFQEYVNQVLNQGRNRELFGNLGVPFLGTLFPNSKYDAHVRSSPEEANSGSEGSVSGIDVFMQAMSPSGNNKPGTLDFVEAKESSLLSVLSGAVRKKRTVPLPHIVSAWTNVANAIRDTFKWPWWGAIVKFVNSMLRAARFLQPNLGSVNNENTSSSEESTSEPEKNRRNSSRSRPERMTSGAEPSDVELLHSSALAGALKAMLGPDGKPNVPGIGEGEPMLNAPMVNQPQRDDAYTEWLRETTLYINDDLGRAFQGINTLVTDLFPRDKANRRKREIGDGKDVVSPNSVVMGLSQNVGEVLELVNFLNSTNGTEEDLRQLENILAEVPPGDEKVPEMFHNLLQSYLIASIADKAKYKTENSSTDSGDNSSKTRLQSDEEDASPRSLNPLQKLRSLHSAAFDGIERKFQGITNLIEDIFEVLQNALSTISRRSKRETGDLDSVRELVTKIVRYITTTSDSSTEDLQIEYVNEGQTQTLDIQQAATNTRRAIDQLMEVLSLNDTAQQKVASETLLQFIDKNLLTPAFKMAKLVEKNNNQFQVRPVSRKRKRHIEWLTTRVQHHHHDDHHNHHSVLYPLMIFNRRADKAYGTSKKPTRCQSCSDAEKRAVLPATTEATTASTAFATPVPCKTTASPPQRVDPDSRRKLLQRIADLERKFQEQYQHHSEPDSGSQKQRLDGLEDMPIEMVHQPCLACIKVRKNVLDDSRMHEKEDMSNFVVQRRKRHAHLGRGRNLGSGQYHLGRFVSGYVGSLSRPARHPLKKLRPNEHNGVSKESPSALKP